MPPPHDINDLTTPRKRRRLDHDHSMNLESMYSFTSPSPTTISTRLNPSIGARKIIVKNVNQVQWDRKAYTERVLSRLDGALKSLFDGRDLDEREELYNAVDNVCRQGDASRLYERLERRLRDRASNLGHGDLTSSYATWQRELKSISTICASLFRPGLLSVDSLPKLGCILWRDEVVLKRSIQVLEVISTALDNDRRNDTASLRPIIDMFKDLNIFSSTFGPHFINQSQQWAHAIESGNSLVDWVNTVTTLMDNEMKRAQLYDLGSELRSQLLSTLCDEFIVDKLDLLTQEVQIQTLLTDRDLESLRKLYNLLLEAQMEAKLLPAFNKWVEVTGTRIVLAEDSETMVLRLLTLRRDLNTMCETFSKNPDFISAVRQGFSVFINKTNKSDSTWGTDNSKVGEMIAKYIDTLQRGGRKAIPTELLTQPEDRQISDHLDEVVELFRFLHGKAVFEAFYKRDLAKRLLLSRSESDDAELSMLSRLKQECGSTFTQNLEQMFKDIELSREEIRSYKQRLHNPAIDLTVNVLSSSAWPTYPDLSIVLPSEVTRSLETFHTHYKTKHSNRKIEWKHSLSQCQLKATFPVGEKELVVSGSQAVVLLLFNADGPLSYNHILSETGLPAPELERTLQSLACTKIHPLTKTPHGRNIGHDDTFVVNPDFTHPRWRIKINQIQMKETKEENKATHERVAEDRGFECQAAIVRIMKGRKTIGHSELIADVIKATMSRGALSVGDIKKNIDRLIDKDYMEREDDGYSYVA